MPRSILTEICRPPVRAAAGAYRATTRHVGRNGRGGGREALCAGWNTGDDREGDGGYAGSDEPQGGGVWHGSSAFDRELAAVQGIAMGWPVPNLIGTHRSVHLVVTPWCCFAQTCYHLACRPSTGNWHSRSNVAPEIVWR